MYSAFGHTSMVLDLALYVKINKYNKTEKKKKKVTIHHFSFKCKAALNRHQCESTLIWFY